jgi:cysteine desulfurase
MVIVMWANNETGVIQDMSAIGKICQERNVLFISDATQAIGKIDVDPVATGIDMLACSAHKFYGPKGIGMVYINSKMKVKPEPLIHGGGHEHGLRSGTLNVPAIVGMGEAAKICKEEMHYDMQRIRKWRDEFEKNIVSQLEEVTINGDQSNRLPTVSNICVRFTDSQAVMTKFRTRLAISSGSACSSADPSPSHVLLAMGLSSEEAKASYRFSLGRFTTDLEMEEASRLFLDAVKHYRDQSPVWQMNRGELDDKGL